MECTKENVQLESAQKDPGKRRLPYIDFLRIIAICLVVFNHTEGFDLYLQASSGLSRWIYYGISYLCTIAVPVFYALSGALLLKKEESLRDVLCKRVLKHGVLLLIFSLIYFLYHVSKGTEIWSVREFIYKIYTSESSTHLWYLYSYIPLMLMLPLLRKMARGMTNQEYGYLLIVSVLLFSLRPMLEQALEIPGLSVNFSAPLFSSKAVVFFLWGYFLENRLPESYLNGKMILLGTVLSIVSIGMVGSVVMARGLDFELWFQILPVTTLYMAVKWFFTSHPVKDRTAALITAMGSATFGIYLLEPNFRCGARGVYPILAPWIGEMSAYLVWSVCAVLLGAVVVSLMKKVPILKWLVE